jgi:hypothetical protein
MIIAEMRSPGQVEYSLSAKWVASGLARVKGEIDTFETTRASDAVRRRASRIACMTYA